MDWIQINLEEVLSKLWLIRNRKGQADPLKKSQNEDSQLAEESMWSGLLRYDLSKWTWLHVFVALMFVAFVWMKREHACVCVCVCVYTAIVSEDCKKGLKKMLKMLLVKMREWCCIYKMTLCCTCQQRNLQSKWSMHKEAVTYKTVRHSQYEMGPAWCETEATDHSQYQMSILYWSLKCIYCT